jgi:hypothetical protein
VGSDGDFCSKEHRNQFRLRAGMDRLVEVNKVANLMRRRESAKQIPPGMLICNSALDRRGFMDSRPTRIACVPRLIELRTDAAARPHLAASIDGFLPPRVLPAAGSVQRPRTHAGSVRIRPRETRPTPPACRRRVTFTFPQTPATTMAALASDGGRAHRTFLNLPPAVVRTHPGRGPQVFREPGKAALERAVRLRSFATPAVEGNALRVSNALAFRVPAAQPMRRQSGLTRGPGSLRAAVRPHLLATPSLNYFAEQRAASILMPEIALRWPGAPEAVHPHAFEGRDAVRLTGRIFPESTLQTPRTEELAWRVKDPRLKATGLSQSSAGFARRNGAHFFHLSVKARTTVSSPQVGSSPFVARDELVVPRVPFRNVLAAATGTPEDAPDPGVISAPPSTPPLGPIPVPVAVKHEEHFDSGWDNWVGGVSDWKVDVAGVRTGGLALFLPTLEMSDYDLEFLARIDSRTVNWVVRAAGRDTYLRCTLSAAEGGQVEFSRALVKSGAAEPAVISSQRVAGKPRTAMTVKMSVTGPVFSVGVDGKTIDSWVDDRLATGGIGFLGAADDRARIYWVRVCSPAAPSKEYNFQ